MAAHVDRRSALLLAGAASFALAMVAHAGDATFRVGGLAPAFSTEAADGKRVALADLVGKIVVLEWTNPECPFVAKHYDSGNMQALQREARAAGVVWLLVSSAAPGNLGYLDALEAIDLVETRKAAPAHLLLDRDGRMAEAYGVTVALTMAVIDQKGVLAYHGAIDDKPTAKVEDIAGARNHVREALTAIAAGRPVKPAQTRPYGCVAR